MKPSWILLLTLALVSAATAHPVGWTLTEFQPTFDNGGRANTIAVDPDDNNIMFVASETGGLFRTTDGGTNWQHVDRLPSYLVRSVVYLPWDHNIMIATAEDDYGHANESGGIWRSTDRGMNWSHVTDLVFPRPSPRFSAGEISIAPDGRILVATSQGVASSTTTTNGGEWFIGPLPSGLGAVSVAAQNDLNMIVSDGHQAWRMIDDGSHWTPPIAGIGSITDMHAFARSPFTPTTFYVVNDARQLFVSEDSGGHWSHISSAPAGDPACGGITFVKPILAPVVRPGLRHLTLWFGNRCGLSRLEATQIPGTDRFDYSGTWINSGLDHPDTRDLAFTTGVTKSPLLLASDGGVSQTLDNGASWFLTGGAGGYNALQITEVKGQWVDELPRYDLYMGTQDNGVRASIDLDREWPDTVCCEGYGIEMRKHVPTLGDRQITFTACGHCYNNGPEFIPSRWRDPPGSVGTPAIIDTSLHVQAVNTGAGFSKGMAVTQDLGATWTQYAAFREDIRDLPKLSQRPILTLTGRAPSQPVQYQAIRTGYDFERNFDIVGLVRLTKSRTAATATVSYPAMRGFGGLGINATMYAWYEVFAVDPLDSNHLIAPDVVREKMMESHDGGNSWVENTSLTALVTASGRFNFRNEVFPHASAVSFSFDDPSSVAVGTMQGGLLVSSDHGAHWMQVFASQHATYITSIEWASPTEAYVSTYGRGLWHLQGIVLAHVVPDICIAYNCALRYIDMGDPAPNRFGSGIAVLDGEIRGARAENGVLREVFVSPGSSLVHIGDSKRLDAITVTQTAEKRGFDGVTMPPTDREVRDLNVVGLAVNEKGQAFGALYNKGPLRYGVVQQTAIAAKPADEPKEEPSASPTAGKPYVSLSAKSGTGGPVGPGDKITISGTDFPAGHTVEVLVDAQAVGKAEASANGVFTVTIVAPTEFGLRRVIVRDGSSHRNLDGAMFIVRHGDERGEIEQGGSERDKHKTY